MTYLIDTNICIYLIKQRPAHILKKLRQFSINDIKISSISVAELQYGIAKSQRSQHNQTVLDEFLVPFEIVTFDHHHSFAYGEIRATLEKAGNPIGSMDMLIAAHALADKHTLVTNNTKEFTRIKALSVEDWTLSND